MANPHGQQQRPQFNDGSGAGIVNRPGILQLAAVVDDHHLVARNVFGAGRRRQAALQGIHGISGLHIARLDLAVEAPIHLGGSALLSGHTHAVAKLLALPGFQVFGIARLTLGRALRTPIGLVSCGLRLLDRSSGFFQEVGSHARRGPTHHLAGSAGSEAFNRLNRVLQFVLDHAHPASLIQMLIHLQDEVFPIIAQTPPRADPSGHHLHLDVGQPWIGREQRRVIDHVRNPCGVALAPGALHAVLVGTHDRLFPGSAKSGAGTAVIDFEAPLLIRAQKPSGDLPHLLIVITGRQHQPGAGQRVRIQAERFLAGKAGQGAFLGREKRLL